MFEILVSVCSAPNYGIILECKNEVLSILFCLLNVVFEAWFVGRHPPLCDRPTVHGSIQDDLISYGDPTHLGCVTFLVANS